MCNTDPVNLGKYEKKTFFNAHHIYERQNTFKTYYATMNDVMEVAKQNPEVKFRYILSATEKLPGNVIFVNPEDLKEMYNIGYRDAISAINHNSTSFNFIEQ